MRNLTIVFLLLVCVLSAGERKKILYIDSYHPEYTWSSGVLSGVLSVIDTGKYRLKIHYMDTKRNRDEEFKIQAAEATKKIIEAFQPDIVIASDDNASKYLISPYYKNTKLPVVFCGINWDASQYGFPADNITGMIEVDLIQPLVEQLLKHSKGDRLGYLSLNSLSAQKVSSHNEIQLKRKFNRKYFVSSYSEWKEKFLLLQDEVDILIFGNPQGLEGWNEEEFIPFAFKHCKIPSGTTASWRVNFSLLGYVRIAEEQGEWAANTAQEILNGKSPKDFPIAKNVRGTLFINQDMADTLSITLSPSLFKRAQIVQPLKK